MNNILTQTFRFRTRKLTNIYCNVNWWNNKYIKVFIGAKKYPSQGHFLSIAEVLTQVQKAMGGMKILQTEDREEEGDTF
jgi:hypothetical protein